MRTSIQIKAELEKTNSRISRLKDLTVSQGAELSSLEAAKLKLETELTTAPESESAADKYINSHYKRPDKQ
jgi:chromosome segregation ATPase